MQKLIIKNKYQSPNRVNILAAAGIAQINEPIFPQNGERIFGKSGVVTFNQASQYSEEENPDAPITPPNCTNCGGGIPPEVPPERQPTYICTSDCGDNQPFSVVIQNAPGFILRSSTQGEDRVYYINGGYNQDYNLNATFALYEDALEYLEQACQEKIQSFLDYKETLLNEYYASDDYQVIDTLTFKDTPSIEGRKVYMQVCREYTNFDDGSSTGSVIKGYASSSSYLTRGMIYSFYITYYKKMGNGQRIFYRDEWVIGRMFFSSYYVQCEKCNDCNWV